MGRLTHISTIIDKEFAGFGLTNYKSDYSHLTKKGSTVLVNEKAKALDGALQMRCFALKGIRKSTFSVKMTGKQAFANGGGCCTTCAFAVAYKLLESGITDRIEIIGQTSFHNGHMWVVVGRTGATVQDGVVKRPANTHATWGKYIVVDIWLKAFGWDGVWKNPPNGQHHSFIEDDIGKLEVTYDSTVPEGDSAD